MKKLFVILNILPLFVFAQKIKTNEYDKFIKQKVIETAPVNVKTGLNTGMSVSLRAVGTDYYVNLKGYGSGASTISEGDEVIFLLANDSTVSAKSTGLQLFEVDAAKNRSTYNHEYKVTVDGLQKLSKNEVVGIRKYGLKNYVDIDNISNRFQNDIRNLALLFLSEVDKSKEQAFYVNAINLQDVQKHIGDSITVCGKIFTTRYLPAANNKPTLLNMGAPYPEQLLTLVIYEPERPLFGDEPETVFKDRDVCVAGKIELYNNRPQIILRKKEQVLLKAVNNSSDNVKK